MVCPKLESEVLLGVALGKSNSVEARLCSELDGKVAQSADTFGQCIRKKSHRLDGEIQHSPLTATVLPGWTADETYVS